MGEVEELLNTVLLGALVVGVLLLPGYALNTLIVVVLVRGALRTVGAFLLKLGLDVDNLLFLLFFLLGLLFLGLLLAFLGRLFSGSLFTRFLRALLIFLVKSSIAFLFSLRATLIVTSYNRPPAFFFLLFVPLSYPPLCRPSHHPPCVPV